MLIDYLFPKTAKVIFPQKAVNVCKKGQNYFNPLGLNIIKGKLNQTKNHLSCTFVYVSIF